MSTATLPEIGMHTGVPMADYLAMDAVSASALEIFRRSPLQYRHAREHPPEPTPEIERGIALHMAILEPDRFATHYVTLDTCEGVKKDGTRCTYAGSVWRDGRSYCGVHDPARGEPVPVKVLPAEMMQDVLGMRDAILAHPRARTLFAGRGGSEVTALFEDPEARVLCKFRPDRLVERAGMLIDLKTTRDAAPWAFPGDAERRGYFRKLAFYRRGLRALGWPYQATAIVAVESHAPYDLICYLIDETALDSAEREVVRLLRQYRQCHETDTWPGYQTGEDGFATLVRPGWAKDYTESEG